MTVDYEEERVFPPLYHYCDINAFKSIVQSGEIWLSSLSQANDSMEGKLPTPLLEMAISDLKLEPIVRNRVLGIWSNLSENIDCCAMCLSTEPDLLSQWRGYAANGGGFSIGFDPEALHRLKFPPTYEHGAWGDKPGLYYVTYEKSEQLDLVTRLVQDMVPNMQKYEEIAAERAGSIFKGTNVLRSLGDTMFNWLSNAYSMKGAAFNEEREARLVYLAPLMESMHRYRVRGSALIPYIPIPISTGTLSPILHVRKGPTNRTPLHVVKGFLEANGLADVEVLESDATYIG